MSGEIGKSNELYASHSAIITNLEEKKINPSVIGDIAHAMYVADEDHDNHVNSTEYLEIVKSFSESPISRSIFQTEFVKLKGPKAGSGVCLQKKMTKQELKKLTEEEYMKLTENELKALEWEWYRHNGKIPW